STQILEILPKAAEGKVGSLFLARNKHSWGRYDEDSGSAELFREKKPKSIDLTGLAASYTHLNGGRVFIIPEEEMPQPSTRVNAIYRPQQ
ncbi:MAG: hypothetical protein H6558_20570, partial [Lewinellaceae bacterium]|nr:hypothetical protein [Lewinellaceae bacterium]